MKEKVLTNLFVAAIFAAVFATSCNTIPASLSELQSKYAQMDSVKVHYKSFGKGDKTVVFVHGFGCDMYCWEKQFDGLKEEKGVKLLFIDLPGFGASDKPQLDYDLQFFADAVKCVMSAETAESAVFVGHSLGTPVCRQLLLTGSKGALVDIDGVYCFYSEPVSPEYEAAIQAFASSFKGEACRSNIEAFVSSLAGPHTPAAIIDYAKATMPQTAEYVASSTMGNLVERKWWTGATIDAPARIICSQNTGLDEDNKEKMAALYPDMAYTELTTCGHFIQMELPDLVNKEILAALYGREIAAALPVGQDSIRVLFIGNSFTFDATEHLPGILNAAGINNFSMERAFHGSYTLVAYNENFDDPKVCIRYKYEPGYEEWDGCKIYKNENCNSSLTAFWDSGRDYDIVVLQEYTGRKYAWDGFEESQLGIDAVSSLMDRIRSMQPEKEPVFVYLMSQVFATDSERLVKYFDNDRSRMYAAMVEHTKQALEQTGIKYLISTGTAVENLRTTSLNVDNGMDLSRDLFHLDKGITRYTANCTVFESILGPCVGKTMDGNSYRFATSDTSNKNYTTPVTDDNAPIAIEAARKAIEKPLEVSELRDL